jgi:undecaprenyl diphosphate synthase
VGTPTATSAPLHVAIIMDGNGRWAKARGLPRVAGHRQGVEAVRSIVDAAPDLGVTHLTLYGFSTENWQRPEAEVSALMGLLRLYLRNEARKLHKDNVQVRFIGQKELISPDLQDLMDKTTALTASNTRLVLTIALSYGGRWDIACAMQRLAEQVKDGSLNPQDITESNISAALSTSGIPDPDLLIRTSGEQRVSNFLLWQCAYAEMIFTDTLWPDFDGKCLGDCIDQFGNRERRFGTVTA